ncbi:MAG: TMEM175 family protein [Bacteroidia bacterium]
MDKEKKYIKEEIRKEFQLERMILFSDTVFATVMTLMAIEIRFPENSSITAETLPKELIHLMPVLVAYTAAFFFIGSTWYEHLRIFSLLKDYDKGLVP